MGFMDGIKDKASKLAGKHGDKIDRALDKAGAMAKDKLGPEHAEKIDRGVERGKGAVQDLGQGKAGPGESGR